MRCSTCGRRDALGLITLAPNVHEKICDDCWWGWTTHRDKNLFRLLVLLDDGAGALHVFREFQRERAPLQRAA